MEKSEDLEKVVCDLDPKTSLPKHAFAIPIYRQKPNLPKAYCCDSRKSECKHSLIVENSCYCCYDGKK